MQSNLYGAMIYSTLFYETARNCTGVPLLFYSAVKSTEILTYLLLLSVSGGGLKCDKYACLFVCLVVCLSACICRKPHGWTSPIFVHVACCRGSVLLLYVMYFRFCGWRHVCTQWALWWCIMYTREFCVFLSGESVTAETTALIPTKFCWRITISKLYIGGEVCYLRLFCYIYK